ncbi:MAG TPA: PAS domain S-box protein [Caulobacteraceae bacterium]|nr:PAS domain S-box protein [Caulobacteraceae bacterium]
MTPDNPSPAPDSSDRTERDLAYAALFDTMAEGFALCDPISDDAGRLTDYVIIDMNSALRGMLGVGTEVIGAKLSRTGPPYPPWLAVCDEVFRTGRPTTFDFHNRATGRWHEIRIGRVAENRLAQFFFDITERKRAEAELNESRGYLRLILDAAADAFYCIDREGVTTHCNSAFLRMLGFSSESDVIGRKLHDVIHHSHGDGSDYDRADCPIYQGARDGAPRHVADERFFRQDGASFPVEYWVRPILRDGALTGAICTFQDITARQAAEESQGLLLREINHRIKNLFAVIDGIVMLSSRADPGARPVVDAIRGRLGSIARAHELILPSVSIDGAVTARLTHLGPLADAVLAPYADPADSGAPSRLRIGGPPATVGEKAANALALVLHELATNAVKYGALSKRSGTVTVAWSITADDLELCWKETGGPILAGSPPAEGFGSLLVRRSVAGHLGGRLARDWAPEGLIVNIVVPLDRLGA